MVHSFNRLFAMRDRRLSELSGDPAEVFLDFGYPELKWLCLLFVFLSSLFLVCSIFSLRRTSYMSGLVWLGSLCTWGLFLYAVAQGGQGLWQLYQIAENLVLQERNEEFSSAHYSDYVRSTYWSLDLAGFAFVLGLAAYVTTHACHIFVRKRFLDAEPNESEAGS